MAPIAIDTPQPPTVESLKQQTAIKPDLKPWIEPPVTGEDLPWANLATIDLAKLDDSDPQVQKELYAQAKQALSVDGFILVEGLGVTPEQIARQQAINQLVTSGTPIEVKQQYKADMAGGDYTGYKVKGSGGEHDYVEFYNLANKSYGPDYPLPPTILPYLDEVKVRVLELPDDYLWNLHDQEQPIGAASQRFMAYYFPEAVHEFDALVKGHTDFNTISLLFNQPISALQILTPENEWRWVRYKPGTVVVNVADALDFLSGGVLKATRHRVVKPPQDQKEYIRYILINFARARYDVELKPIEDSPVVQREGKHAFPELVDAGGKAPTQGEWLAERIKGVQKRLDTAKDGGFFPDGLREDETYLGKTVKYYD